MALAIIKAERERGGEQGLSPEEIVFYDALAENNSAVDLLGDDKLRVIATELVISVRNNVSVDWMHRDSARAKLWLSAGFAGCCCAECVAAGRGIGSTVGVRQHLP